MELVIPKVEKGGSALITKAEAATPVYPVTSRRKFRPRSIIVTNPVSGTTANVRLYDLVSAAETLRLQLMVRDNDTVVLNRDDLYGAPDFLTSVVAVSSVSGVFIMVGGDEW